MPHEITRRALPLTIAAPLAMQIGLLEQILKGADVQRPDPKAVEIKLPADLEFPATRTSGGQEITLWGDPNKDGSLYGVHHKWYPHSNSMPHMHKNDRYIWVLKGTWWLGSGANYDMATTYPVPAGTFVRHAARELHYDGAKDEPCELLIVGLGPAGNLRPDQASAPEK